MIPLKTAMLIKKLVPYSFFDWEEEREDCYVLHIGMGPSYLEEFKMNSFYDSWGFDAVDNPHAKIKIRHDQWLMLENTFFDWMTRYKHLWCSKEILVTPSLTNGWFAFDWDCYQWGETTWWMKADYEAYRNLLLSRSVIHAGPTLKEDHRGALILSHDALIIVGKMSTRGLPLLFFIGHQGVVRITEHLSVKVYVKDASTMNCLREMLAHDDHVCILE